MMNINQIKATTIFAGPYFKTYPVPMRLVIENPHIKNWIENLQKALPPDQLRSILLNEGQSYVKIRHNADGSIREMEISQCNGPLCCMSISKPEEWPDVLRMIEG